MEDALVSGLDSLSPPDSHYVNAAWGWLELDNITEAFLELDRVSSPGQLHPDVLTLRWELLARKKQWADALEIHFVTNRSDKNSGCITRVNSRGNRFNGRLKHACNATTQE